ncbi:TlpA family protein disulfide reductase [Planctomycetota bacterium]|nr:TlpA family protein disulfide reductase [Planctomycetota bacterium]
MMKNLIGMCLAVVAFVFCFTFVGSVEAGVWNRPKHPLFEKYNRKVMVMGEVVEHMSGKPIKQFSVIIAETYDDASMRWWPSYRFRFQRFNGEFTCSKWLHNETDFVVIVTAAGYEPYVSKPFKAGELKDAELIVNADLAKAEVMSGRVVDWNGKPVRDADVLLPEAGLGNGKIGEHERGDVKISTPDGFSFSDGVNHGMTDVGGVFYVTKPKREYMIGVYSPDGYAMVRGEDFEDGGEIVLKKWGRIKGQIKLGERAAGEESSLAFDDDEDMRAFLKRLRAGLPTVRFYRQTRLGENGNYVSPLLPSGEYRIGLYVQHPDKNSATPMHFRYRTIGNGECKTVDMGGKGCTLRGQLISKGESRSVDQVSVTLNQSPLVYHFELPVNFDELDRDEKYKWMVEATKGVGWWKYAEESEKKAKQKVVWQETDKDGQFVFYDLPEGDWQLLIGDNEEQYHFDVKREKGDEDVFEQVVKIELNEKEKDQREIRELMRDSSVELDTAFGEKVKLADYQGKYVLIHYWGLWCGACERDVPKLKEIAKRFEDRDDFAMVGVVNADHNRKMLMGHIAEKGMDWVQILDDGGLPVRLSNQSFVPTYVLISKDGMMTVLGQDLELVQKLVSD